MVSEKCFNILFFIIFTTATEESYANSNIDLFNNNRNASVQLVSSVSNASYDYENITEDILTTTPATDLLFSEYGITQELNVTIPPYDLYNLNITVRNVTGFILAQIHSYRHFLSLSNGNTTIKGTNIGSLYFPTDSHIILSIKNFNGVTVKGLLFITSYNKKAPVPGISYNDNVGMPTPNISVYHNLIKLTANRAMTMNQDGFNNKSKINYRLFYMYSAERDLTEESYFKALRSMSSIKNMEKYATEYKLNSLNKDANKAVKASFANYPGAGVFYGLVAVHDNFSSSYVIVQTYGCNFSEGLGPCFFIVNTFEKVGITVLCAAGLLLCMNGCKWKTFELIVTSFLTAAIPTYAALYNVFASEDNVNISSGIGALVAFFMVVALFASRSLHVYHSMAFLNFGIFFAAAIMYAGVGNLEPFKSDVPFWSAFVGIVLTAFLVNYMNIPTAHFFTSAVFGGFLAVITVDYFSGCSLKYIIIDTIRRAYVDGFIAANIDPPFQTPDIVLTVLWFFMATVGTSWQYYQHMYCCINSDSREWMLPESQPMIHYSYPDSECNKTCETSILVSEPTNWYQLCSEWLEDSYLGLCK